MDKKEKNQMDTTKITDNIDAGIESGLKKAEEKKAKFGEWISVEERLPEVYSAGDSRDVLVYDSHHDQVFIAYYGTDWWDQDSDWRGWTVEAPRGKNAESLHNVTHWQPLPEPPKEEK